MIINVSREKIAHEIIRLRTENSKLKAHSTYDTSASSHAGSKGQQQKALPPNTVGLTHAQRQRRLKHDNSNFTPSKLDNISNHSRQLKIPLTGKNSSSSQISASNSRKSIKRNQLDPLPPRHNNSVINQNKNFTTGRKRPGNNIDMIMFNPAMD
jgi:hypothetical protein